MLRVWAGFVTGPLPGALELLGTLRHHQRLACLSNTSILHWQDACADYALDRFFARHFLSFEAGLHKPDPRFFEHALAALDCPAQSVLYFDDSAANVASASRVGLDARLVTSPGQAAAVLAAVGLLAEQ